jgi:hypothetical protein
VVFLVKNRLALAFSLAGIVAAVSFRNRISDTRDAVFVLVVIGIGLAAGVQRMVVAYVTSLAFNVTTIFLTARDYGRKPAQLDGWYTRPRKKKAAAVEEGQEPPDRGGAL